jgi:drug/metabolite transporter (DMT)-like permease
MTAGDAGRLVALAAIWGSSFLFMRIAAPALGPVLTADLRMLIAGAALAVYLNFLGVETQWRRWWRQYLLVGVLTSALPFSLYAYAALEVSAGVMAVLNATAPMWGALLGVVILRERLGGVRLAGLALGVAGVALLTRAEGEARLALLGIAACLGAAFFYGLASVYLKRFAAEAPARGMALGTQLAAAALLAHFLAAAPPSEVPAPLVLGAILALGLLCGAVAYILYFRLIADLGPAGALTVTYLIPLFGVLWGVLFLGETVSLSMVAGGGLVVLGTILVLKN